MIETGKASLDMQGHLQIHGIPVDDEPTTNQTFEPNFERSNIQ